MEEVEKMRRNHLCLITKARVLSRDDFKCANCGSIKQLHIHHILPISEGGSDDVDNLKTLCVICHKKEHKGTFTNIIMCFPPDVAKWWDNLPKRKKSSKVVRILLEHIEKQEKAAKKASP